MLLVVGGLFRVRECGGQKLGGGVRGDTDGNSDRELLGDGLDHGVFGEVLGLLNGGHDGVLHDGSFQGRVLIICPVIYASNFLYTM